MVNYLKNYTFADFFKNLRKGLDKIKERVI